MGRRMKVGSRTKVGHRRIDGWKGFWEGTLHWLWARGPRRLGLHRDVNLRRKLKARAYDTSRRAAFTVCQAPAAGRWVDWTDSSFGRVFTKLARLEI